MAKTQLEMLYDLMVSYKDDLNDIKNSVVSFFSEEELKSSFKIFTMFEFGLMERSIIGDTEKIISHWFFRAKK